MGIDEFWDIVGRVHAASPSDMKNKCLLLGEELRRVPVGEVLSFGRHFSDCFYKAYHWDIWGAAIIITHGCCGDDSFMDFRSTLISLGRAPFEAAMKDADSLANFDIDPAWAKYEGYQYVVGKVLRESEPFDISNETGPGHPQTVSGIRFVEWELSKRFPRLATKYGHKDSDYSVEKEYATRLARKVQIAAKVKRIMLNGIILSCGVIPPYRVVARILRSGRSPVSSKLQQTWETFDFEENHYWPAAFELEKATEAELESRPDLKGVRLKIDHSIAPTDEFDVWLGTLKERGLA